MKSLEAKLDDLRDAVANRSRTRTEDEQIWLTRFLLIRACGYLEQVVFLTVRAHLTDNSWGRVRSFSLSWVERGKNPSVGNLGGLVGRLDGSYEDEFKDFLDANDSYLRNGLELLVNRRNLIAHGHNEGLSTEKALDSVAVAKEIANWFILRLAP